MIQDLPILRKSMNNITKGELEVFSVVPKSRNVEE